ncbi:MAG: hypothetical protein Q7S03_00875 [bacterium]|nr:hypothetical protein [bacterium]
MNQKGNVIVVVAMSVALIGILGAIFWRNSPTQPRLPSISTTPSSTPDFSKPSSAPTLSTGVLNVIDVTGNKQLYIDKKISIYGKVVLRERLGAGPECAGGSNCPSNVGEPTLHLVNPDANQWTEGNAIDLYKKIGEGKYETLTCKVVTKSNYDCGKYKDNSVTTIQGIFIKYQIPAQTIGTSSGKTEVIKWQDIYILVVE